MSTAKHVGVDVLTGFLGSGKTTILRRAMQGTLGNARVAVVVNEIGEIGIDGREITGLSYAENVVELNSGCICCTIEDYRFDLAVAELIDAVDPTLIVIETTGLADPGPLLERIAQAGLALDAVSCVVDAESFAKAAVQSVVAKRQVAAADFIVLTKTDLVDPAETERIAKRLRKINRRALLLRGEHGSVEGDVLFATSPRTLRSAEPLRKAPQGHLHEDGFAALSLSSPACFDRRRFERMLGRLPREIFRAKGLVRFAGEAGCCLFNYTCGRTEWNWIGSTAGAGQAQAVFIGRDMARLEPRLRESWSRCEAVTNEA